MEIHEEYDYQVFYSPEDQSFVGICGQMPRLSHLDDSLEAAFRGIVFLVKASIQILKEEGKQIPRVLYRESPKHWPTGEDRLV